MTMCRHGGMIRTQIRLTEEQLAAALRHRAAERGVSVAGLVRAAVDRQLADDDSTARRQRMIDVLRNAHYRSNFTDISERHDDYLAEDFM